jgi:hypothetical protein
MIEILLTAILAVLLFSAYKLHVLGSIFAEAKLLGGELGNDISKAVHKSNSP